jgi:hypothetical protein
MFHRLAVREFVQARRWYLRGLQSSNGDDRRGVILDRAFRGEL